MANEDKIFAGDATATLNHPVIGSMALHDNMTNEGIRVSITSVYNRQVGHDTGDVARKIRRRGLPKAVARITTQEMRDDILALLFSDLAPVSSGVTITDTDGNGLLPTLGDLTIHPVENGSDTTGDIVLHNVRCATETLEFVFSNEDGQVHYPSEIVLEAVAEAGDTVFTIGATSDTTPPTVSSNLPIDAASSQAIDCVVSATFDSEMNLTDMANLDNFTIMSEDGVEVASLTLSFVQGTKTVTIGHADFATAKTYIVMVNNVVRDLAGNELAAKFAWNFGTTA